MKFNFSKASKILFFLIPVFTLIASMLNAQDVIILKNGQRVKSNIIEVNKSVINYKLYSVPDSPVYSINKSEVRLIKYEDGSEDIFKSSDDVIKPMDPNSPLNIKYGFFFGNLKYFKGDRRISKAQFSEMIEDDPENFIRFKRGNSNYNIGNLIGIPTGYIFGYNIGTLLITGKVNNSTVFATSGLLWAGSLLLFYSGKYQMNKAIYRINEGLDSRINFRISKDGIGLVFKI